MIGIDEGPTLLGVQGQLMLLKQHQPVDSPVAMALAVASVDYVSMILGESTRKM